MSAFNRGVIREQVTNKIKTLCIHAIANEAFQRSLPFDEINEKDSLVLSQFMYSAIESLGGASLLDNAMKQCKDPAKLSLLQEMNNICMEACASCSNRCIQECVDRNKSQVSSKDDTVGISNERIIQNIQLNQKEYETFMNKVQSMDIDKISQCINEEVIDTIKKEKEAYKKEDELKEQIAMELEKDENSKSTLESLMNIKFGKHGVKSHVSVFSTIQEIVMESLMAQGFEDSNIYKDVDTIAFNAALNKKVENGSMSLESIGNFLVESADAPNMESLTQTGYINTIVVYTALETLQTMNLINYDLNTARKFVDEHSKTKDIIESSIESTTRLIDGKLSEMQKTVESTTSKTILAKYLASVQDFKEKISGVTESTSVYTNNISKIKNNVNALESLINEKLGTENLEVCTESTLDTTDRRVISDVSQLSKLNLLMGKNPRVKSINIINDKATEGTISVYGYDDHNNIVANSFIRISHDYTDMGLESYLGKIKEMSKLNNIEIPVYVNSRTGKGNIAI